MTDTERLAQGPYEERYQVAGSKGKNAFQIQLRVQETSAVCVLG